MHCENGLDALIHFRALLFNLKIEKPHSNTHSADVEILTQSVNPIRLKNNPIELDIETIKTIYERILQ